MRPNRTAIDAAYRLASPCRICPRRCGVDRPSGQTGYCKIRGVPIVASAGPHFGEEPPLVGAAGGSGTIFLSGCNLMCVFCQNHDVSHGAVGAPADPTRIAKLMLELAELGCPNINFVTPTHVAPWLMDAVARARDAGLRIPIVWNCGGYEDLEMLRLLEGTVDIYMPDAKFWDPATAERLARAPDYPDRMREALHEMHRQVGDLCTEPGPGGVPVATRGLLVRHLVMPGGLAETRAILDFIATEISRGTWVNVMGQYRPLHRAREHPDIARPLTRAEHAEAVAHARALGLHTFA